MLRFLAVVLAGLATACASPVSMKDVTRFPLNVPLLEQSPYCRTAEDAVAIVREEDEKVAVALATKFANEGRCGTVRGYVTYRKQVFKAVLKNGDLGTVYQAEVETNAGTVTIYILLWNYLHEGIRA